MSSQIAQTDTINRYNSLEMKTVENKQLKFYEKFLIGVAILGFVLFFAWLIDGIFYYNKHTIDMLYWLTGSLF